MHTLPPLFLERLARIYPGRTGDSIVQTLGARRPTTFRVNALVAAPEAIRQSLHEAGFQLERVPWHPAAFILKNRSRRDLTDTAAYRSGQIYVQSLSSMLPPLALDPQPGETILDLTAAPGSKTTQIASLMRNRGKVIANDNNKPRFFKLLANVKLQAAGCVECTMYHGETLWRRWSGTFDRVLVDAPCSAEGRFDASVPTSYRYWKPKKIHEMMRKQKRLLFSAIRLLKPGGILVYSTCTFAPEENEGVISWALEKFHEIIEHLPCRVPVAGTLPGLLIWEGKTFLPALRHTIRIMPTATMEGFFLAKLVKRG